jgi:hypothetical protein
MASNSPSVMTISLASAGTVCQPKNPHCPPAGVNRWLALFFIDRIFNRLQSQ